MTSSKKPIIFVAGLQRCGTSLTMQLLDKAGVICEGSYPDYEDRPWYYYNLEQVPFEAVKCMYMGDSNLPKHQNCKVILLSRNLEQQAKSTAKFMEAVMGLKLSRQDFKAMRRSLPNEQQILKDWAKQYPTLNVSFESLINQKEQTCQRIIDFLYLDADPKSLAKQIFTRTAQNYDGLLEVQLIKLGKLWH